MGKWKDDGEFRIESHLNKPPKVLSKAIELLQSDHDFREGSIKHYIDEVAIKSTKLPALKDYRFPGRDQDQLFRPDYRHAGGENCSACDATQVEKQLSRESEDPVVHYGLIASGNAVMRSAQRRDELRDAWDVICFEMEAAGLMDDFPCVVIRGICDYSDDHKHKLWQPYCAVVAAAYAKDLLRVIQPWEVENTEVAAKVIKQC
jgi:nucleoside phosphorylase